MGINCIAGYKTVLRVEVFESIRTSSGGAQVLGLGGGSVWRGFEALNRAGLIFRGTRWTSGTGGRLWIQVGM